MRFILQKRIERHFGGLIFGTLGFFVGLPAADKTFFLGPIGLGLLFGLIGSMVDLSQW